MEYTPSLVWSVLIGESEDIDEQIDVQVGLARLPLSQRTFLVYLGQGYTASFAMQQAGLTGNQTRVKREALQRLTSVINGIEEFAHG